MSDDTTTVEADDTEDLEDFDAFWASQTRKHKRVKMFGQIVHLPPSLPLQFEMEARKLQRSKADKDVKKLIAILFGAGAMEAWTKDGMDLEQFQVMLAWAPRAIAGQDITLAEVAEEVRTELAKRDVKSDDEAEGEPDPT
jgi:hypothetical protein